MTPDLHSQMEDALSTPPPQSLKGYWVELMEADKEVGCKRLYWNRMLERGTGLLAKGEILSEQMEAASREDMRMLRAAQDLTIPTLEKVIGEILQGAQNEPTHNYLAKELLWRRLGWVAAQALFFEPALRSHYDYVELPETIVINKDPMFIHTPLGILLRDKFTGEFIYRDIQLGPCTTPWLDHFAYRGWPQLVMQGLSEELKVKVETMQVVGLNNQTGITTDRTLTPGAWRNPYVYGKWHITGGTWSPYRASERIEYANQTRPKAIWEHPLGLVRWVQSCGGEVAMEQIKVSPKIRLDKAKVSHWLTQRLHREEQLEVAAIQPITPKMLATYFPQNGHHCIDLLTGKQCAYHLPCWVTQGGGGREIPADSFLHLFTPNPANLGLPPTPIEGELTNP